MMLGGAARRERPALVVKQVGEEGDEPEEGGCEKRAENADDDGEPGNGQRARRHGEIAAVCTHASTRAPMTFDKLATSSGPRASSSRRCSAASCSSRRSAAGVGASSTT